MAGHKKKMEGNLRLQFTDARPKLGARVSSWANAGMCLRATIVMMRCTRSRRQDLETFNQLSRSELEIPALHTMRHTGREGGRGNSWTLSTA